MDDKNCPFCQRKLPRDFLKNTAREKNTSCIFCKSPILITNEGRIIPRSECFGETVILRSKEEN